MLQHSHLYGFMDETCYRLPIMETQSKIVWTEEMPSDTRASILPGAKHFMLNVNINTSDFVKPITNEDYCSEILAWAKDTKAKSIVDLRNVFKVEVDFLLYTGRNELIYEGTTAQSLEAKEILIPSPVDEELNTLSYRKGIRFEKSLSFEKACPPSYGIMKGIAEEDYFFLIKAIRIKGISDEGFVDKKPEFLTSVIDLSGRRRYARTVTSENTLPIFNSEVYNIEFPPEKIQFRPKELTVMINVVMNNFCEFGDEDALLAIIHENNGGTTSESDDLRYPCHPHIHPHHGAYVPHPTRPIHPVHPPFPLVPPTPENPDEGDEENKDPSVDPDNTGDVKDPGTTGNEGEGTEPENPDTGDNTEVKDPENTGTETEDNKEETPGENTGGEETPTTGESTEGGDGEETNTGEENTDPSTEEGTVEEIPSDTL